MSYMIETIGLTKRFGDLTAVDNVNLTVDNGEIFGLLGPNGAGKSTFLSMLCTILRPTTGTAFVNGYNVITQAAQVRKSMGIIFQDPSIDDKLTARQNMKIHANLYDVPRKVINSRIDEVMRLVGLEDRADSKMSTYSGGMRRRLEIARSLIHYPKILFLDEPTVGLDPQSRSHIWNYIKDLKKRENITIILTTHYLEEADKLCDRIAIIDKGKIIALDSPAMLKNHLDTEKIIIKSNNDERLRGKVMEARLAEQVINENGELVLSVKNAHSTIARVVELAVANGIYIENVSLLEPNLDEVFMHYTGRDIRASDNKELVGMEAIMRRQRQ
jgi:ABC-2 type transport system ATP-binding protein